MLKYSFSCRQKNIMAFRTLICYKIRRVKMKPTMTAHVGPGPTGAEESDSNTGWTADGSPSIPSNSEFVSLPESDPI